MHTLRTHLRADSAPRAVVDRVIDGRLAGPEALRLRAGILGAGEQRRHGRHGAVLLADRALHAVIERAAHQVAEDVAVLVIVGGHAHAIGSATVATTVFWTPD